MSDPDISPDRTFDRAYAEAGIMPVGEYVARHGEGASARPTPGDQRCVRN